MAEFNIRSESVDVEQIMRDIRARIKEKRGVDYTEEQIRELATVRLEKFLDPRNLRSDLLEQFRKSRPALPADALPIVPPYTFDDRTIFTSHRPFLRAIRRLLRPLLQLFFNPNTLNHVLHQQAQFNIDMLKRDERRKAERGEWNVLYYEVLHNLVLETTRMSIEVKNLRMRVESLSSRLDFSERRVRALEGVVQYRPEAMRPRDRRAQPAELPEAETIEPGAASPAAGSGATQAGQTVADGAGRRRRRRRRGRRGVTSADGTVAGGPVGETAVDEMPESDDAAPDVETRAPDVDEGAPPSDRRDGDPQ
jgi:hypothetical protein